MFFLIFVALFLLNINLQAEEQDNAAAINKLADMLPLPDAHLDKGSSISSFDEKQLKLVIPELQDYVRDGQFTGLAFSKLPFSLQNGVECCHKSDPAITLSDNATLSSLPSQVTGLLFDPNQTLTGNTATYGYSALWNFQTLWLGSNYINSNIRIRYIRNNSVFRELQGSYSLIYPRQFSPTDKTGQVFRELLKITKPTLVQDFSWLRFRFYEPTDDALFMYSPVIKKVRELTNSNTSDSLLNSSVALDDLLVWSQKINSVTILSYSEDLFLMPVVVAAASAAKASLKSDECRELTNPEFNDDQPRVWSYQSQQISGASAWLLNQAVYVPRTMLRLFVETSDPYSQYGRQIIYIDKATGLVIYKIVFDNSGQLWKIIIGNYAFSARADSSFPFYPYAQIIIDRKVPQVTLLEFLSFKTCGSRAAQEQLGNFSPTKLVPSGTK